MSSKINLSPHATCAESTCFQFGEHSLVTRLDNQTTPENYSYSLEVADALIYDRSTHEYFESEDYFTVFSSDSDCVDFDGCAADICDPETRLCEIQFLNDIDFSDCTWSALELILENYPDETSWELSSLVDKIQVSARSGK